MSIATSTAKVQYTLSSAVQALPITFYFLVNAHIKAIRARAGVADYVMVLGTDYTLAGAGDEAGGTLTTIATNLQAGDKVTIKRDISFTQETNYVYNDKFPAEVHETALDKLTMMTQQLKEVTDRAVQFPESEVAGTGNIMPAAAGRAAKILGFDATGNAVQLYDPVSAVFAEGDAIYANSVAALKAVSVTDLLNGQQCHVGGYADVGDGAGGTWVYVLASAATENAGTIVAPNSGSGRWFRVFSGAVNAKWFGAKGDGITDDTTAVQAAITAADNVFLPGGTYKITTTLTIPSDRKVFGLGSSTVLLVAANIAAITLTSVSRIVLRDFKINGQRLTYTSASNGGISAPASGTGINDIVIQNVQMTAIGGAGIIILGQSGNQSNRIKIVGCKIEDCGAHGILTQDYVNDVEIVGNYVADVGLTVADRPNITAGRTAVNTLIANNLCKGSSSALGTSSHGISIEGEYATCTGNIVIGVIGYGFEVGTSDYVSVVGNVAKTCTRGGFAVTGLTTFTAKNVTITGNTAVNCGGFGFRTLVGTFGTTFHENIVFSGNVVEGVASPVTALGFYCEYVKGLVIVGNSVRNVPLSGIQTGSCFDVLVADNIVVGCNTQTNASHGGIRMFENTGYTGSIMGQNYATGNGILDYYPTIDGVQSPFPTATRHNNPFSAVRAGVTLGSSASPISSYNGYFNNLRAGGVMGYITGAGGAVTQLTSKSTGVTLNKATGVITMHAATLNAATSVGFTLTNSTIGVDDVVVVSIRSGGTVDSYAVTVDTVAAGSCRIQVRNISGGNLSESLNLNFAVIKGAVS